MPMKTIFKKISAAPFPLKMLTIYLLSLIAVISVVTYKQITASITVVEESTYQTLDMLTEHIAINFSNHQDSCTSNIYSRMRAFGIPGLMNKYNSSTDSSTFGLRYALSQTITEGSDFDYVVVELLDGTTAEAGYSAERVNTLLMREAKDILNAHRDDEYIIEKWEYVDNIGLFFMCELYNTSPLRYAGRAVFHIKDNLFKVSDSYKNTGFIFCDSNYSYISHADLNGASAHAEIIDAVIDGKISTDDYFISQYKTGGWITIGYSSKDIYNETRDNIANVGIRYGILGFIFGIVLIMFPIRSLMKKLRVLKVSMKKVAEGDFGYRAEVIGSDDISKITATFNYMTEQISDLLEELLDKELAKKDAELQILEYKYRSLETQIRPHFIYNALETLNSMAKIKGDSEMAEIVQRISRYFRNITVNTTKQYITAKQEFDALEDYTEIYRLVYGDSLHVIFNVREAAKSAMIPTMIVQPIVENALKHGIRGQNEKSEITVHAYHLNDKLVITVKDCGHGLSDEQIRKINEGTPLTSREHSGIGLENVRQRLLLLYGSHASFFIDNRPEGGAIAKIEIPFTYSEPDDDSGEEWDIDKE